MFSARATPYIYALSDALSIVRTAVICGHAATIKRGEGALEVACATDCPKCAALPETAAAPDTVFFEPYDFFMAVVGERFSAALLHGDDAGLPDFDVELLAGFLAELPAGGKWIPCPLRGEPRFARCAVTGKGGVCFELRYALPLTVPTI